MSRANLRTTLPNKKILLTAIAFALAANATHARADEELADDDQRRATTQQEELETVRVEGAKIKNSPKYTEALVDTPQTITVVDEGTIKEQNLLNLRDILATLPGITFGAGEGGGGYGDSINLRGFSANSDITVDGVRDSAQYTRTDPFNLEQVELTNGANSVYSGAGSVGGTINLVSKSAKLGGARTITAGLGSDDYRRLTADINEQVGEHTAFRVNLMAHQNDVAGRDFESFERWGIAPSIAFGLGTDTQISVSYVHQKDDNVPQYGVPYFMNAYNDGPLDEVDPSDYFGYRNFDRQEIELDMLTAVLDHAFNDTTSLRNLTRAQHVDQFVRVSPPQGTWCQASGINVSTGAECSTPGMYARSGPAGTTRDTTNKILYNQTDVTWNFATGAVQHTLVTGLSLTHETYDLLNGNSLRNPDGATPNPTLPPTSISDPDSYWAGPVNFIRSGTTKGELDNQALYAFDTLKFGERWHLSLGARYERNEGDTRSVTYATPAAGGAATVNPTAENSDNLFSYRGAIVYKPVENASVYFGYGNSKTPSKASVNGSCTASSTTGTANCNIDPETAVNFELGTKWDLLGGRLSLTGSVFRNDRKNYRVADPDPLNPTGEQALDGRARVDGIALGVSGLISDQWSVFANYTHLKSEVLQGVSDFVAGNGQDYTKGDPLVNTPENSLSLWTAYDITRQWQVGYGATWQADNYVQQHSATYPTGALLKSDDYWVHRAMVAFRVDRNLTFQFNVNNLTDKEYYQRIRNNGWATPGEGRQYTLTATYGF